ncbi:M15 family metallopeptidase [Natroniella sulfidigena]|uniref:M15 family metallopeptidase n=1 Tax=Natroniella sulfidigena TaxID=723921 RepID=UPI00200A02C7|nr:M15 family metallopeptidase [Natroniella sulfidigena]MCK8816671.1 M15 family metallopeptidase [Natroniella sulfidigena]
MLKKYLSQSIIVIIVIVISLLIFNFATELKGEQVGLAQEISIINNPLDRLVLVNKQRRLKWNFSPPDLTTVNIPFTVVENSSRQKMRFEAAKMLENLIFQAQQEEIELIGVSGYRSYQRQLEIFLENVILFGDDDSYSSARPGHSEHQTGLAIDLTTPDLNYQLTEELGQHQAGQWLEKWAPSYGFIVRYQQGKEGITGYQYEPWHLRYVGVEAALEIVADDLTLEEYLFAQPEKLLTGKAKLGIEPPRLRFPFES